MDIKLSVFGKVSSKFNCYSLKSVIEQLFDENNTLQLYIVVIPTEPIKNYRYMQACIFHDTKYNHSKCMEMRWESGHKFKHYRRVVNDAAEMLEIFTDFYIDKKIPNILDWEDVSHDLTIFKLSFEYLKSEASDKIVRAFPILKMDKRNIWFTKAQSEYINKTFALNITPNKGIFISKEQQQLILEHCKKSQLASTDSHDSEIENGL